MKCQAQGWSRKSVRVWTEAGPVFLDQGDPRVGTIPLGAVVEIEFDPKAGESEAAARLVADARAIGEAQAKLDARAVASRAEYERTAIAHRGEAAAIDALMEEAD